MRGAFQVLTDCAHCRVEASVIELRDPQARVDVAVEARCRLCGRAAAFGEVTALGAPLLDAGDVVAALAAWAREEGEPDADAFARANFGGLAAAEVAARVVAREPVATSFDVIAWLFPGAGGGVSTALGPPPVAEAPPPSPELDGPPPTDPVTVPRALASVMLADGRIRPGEERFLAACLARLGAPSLAAEDRRVWRPHELPPPPDPGALLEAMRLLALVDREADGSEVRVLHEYARAWGVTLREDALPRVTAMAQLGRALGRLLGS